MAVSDPHVTKALQFIRDHARENMMVMDVASAAALSRRALEIKFRRRSDVQFMNISGVCGRIKLYGCWLRRN
jgi:transcriptional regulator GlxA family with amidase domain